MLSVLKNEISHHFPPFRNDLNLADSIIVKEMSIVKFKIRFRDRERDWTMGEV